MRVLLINRDYPSGQTTHVDGLAAALHDLGVEVVVARLGELSQSMSACLRRQVRQARFHDSEGLVRLARGVAPDVVHAHSGTTWPMAARAARAIRRPLVLTAHGPGLDLPPNKAALTAAAAIVVPGPATARSLATATPMVTIANGVDLSRFRPGPKGSPPVIAYVGRVDPDRRAGFEVFCNATRQLPAEVWFIGAGAVEPPTHVQALGWQPDLASWLARVDVACGVGRSLREAQACGAVGVVLGRRLHGVVRAEALPADPEVTDVWYGHHLGEVPVARAALTLRGDLLTLFSVPAHLGALQRQSRAIAERFADGREKARRHRDLYRRLLKGQRPREAAPSGAAPRSPKGDPLLGPTPGGQPALRLDAATSLTLADEGAIRLAVRTLPGCDGALLTLPGRPALTLRLHPRRGRGCLSLQQPGAATVRLLVPAGRWFEVEVRPDAGGLLVRIDAHPPLRFEQPAPRATRLGPLNHGCCHVMLGAGGASGARAEDVRRSGLIGHTAR